MENEIIRINEKTPIEIALEIDEDGFTTASAIYEWLELDPTHFARWCKDRIINNPYFTKGEDYFDVLAVNGELAVNDEKDKKGGRPSTDYKISADMAKRLCMTSKSEKAIAAQNYFVGVETGLKKYVTALLAKNDAAIVEIQNDIVLLRDHSDKTDTRLGIIESGTVLYQPSRWVKHIISRIALLAEHYVDSKTGKPYSFARMFHFILDQLEYRYPGYNDRIREVEKVLIYNTGIKENRPIQIIDYDVDLRNKFNSFVNHELYNMGIIDEDEDQDEDLAMLRNLMPTVARF